MDSLVFQMLHDHVIIASHHRIIALHARYKRIAQHSTSLSSLLFPALDLCCVNCPVVRCPNDLRSLSRLID
jgi:hypothetical protein